MVVINSGSRLVIITTGRLIDFFRADGGDGREGDEGVQNCVFGTFGLVTDDD